MVAPARAGLTGFSHRTMRRVIPFNKPYGLPQTASRSLPSDRRAQISAILGEPRRNGLNCR
jgi:hypothetical protein